MIYLLAAGAGIVGAIVGWLVTGMATLWIAGLLGVSDFEGGRSMLAFLGVGPLGGVAGMVTAIWLVVRRGRAVGPTVARVVAVLAGIVALTAIVIAIRFATVDTYTNEAPPTLEFEIRLPATLSLADRDKVSIELHTDRNVGTGTLFSPWPRPDGDHQLLVGSVDLAFKTSSRLLVVELPNEPTRLFRLDLSRTPGSTAEPGDWHHANLIHTAGTDHPAAAPPNDPVELRFRVRRPGED